MHYGKIPPRFVTPCSPAMDERRRRREGGTIQPMHPEPRILLRSLEIIAVGALGVMIILILA